MLQEKGHLTEFSEVGYGSKRAVVPHVDYHVLVMVIPIQKINSVQGTRRSDHTLPLNWQDDHSTLLATTECGVQYRLAVVASEGHWIRNYLTEIIISLQGCNENKCFYVKGQSKMVKRLIHHIVNQ